MSGAPNGYPTLAATKEEIKVGIVGYDNPDIYIYIYIICNNSINKG